MCHRSSSSVILINYSCVHNQIATFGLFSRQSVILNIGLNIGCSHHRDNRPSEQSAKCTISQALIIRLEEINSQFTSSNLCLLMMRRPRFSDGGTSNCKMNTGHRQDVYQEQHVLLLRLIEERSSLYQGCKA